MNNVKVVYATKTGHSRKIAQAVAKELNVEPMNIKENPQLKGVDLLLEESMVARACRN